MGIVIAVVVVVVVVVVVAAAIVLARRRRAPRPGVEAAPPLSDLEAALAQVTDRSGRPIGEAIDAEAGHVDELRDPDDTGPVLRRALDRVVRPTAPPSPVAPADDDRPTDDPVDG